MHTLHRYVPLALSATHPRAWPEAHITLEIRIDWFFWHLLTPYLNGSVQAERKKFIPKLQRVTVICITDIFSRHLFWRKMHRVSTHPCSRWSGNHLFCELELEYWNLQRKRKWWKQVIWISLMPHPLLFCSLVDDITITRQLQSAWSSIAVLL